MLESEELKKIQIKLELICQKYKLTEAELDTKLVNAIYNNFEPMQLLHNYQLWHRILDKILEYKI